MLFYYYVFFVCICCRRGILFMRSLGTCSYSVVYAARTGTDDRLPVERTGVLLINAMMTNQFYRYTYSGAHTTTWCTCTYIVYRYTDERVCI